MKRVMVSLLAVVLLSACEFTEPSDTSAWMAEAHQGLVTTVYNNDFSSAVGSSWTKNGVSHATLTTAPSGQQYLGNFANDTVVLSLGGLPTHKSIKITYDVYVVGGWDGATASSAGVDTFSVEVLGSSGGSSVQFGAANYSNTSAQQYVSGFKLAAARTGAKANGTLGYAAPGDSVYAGAQETNHTNTTVAFRFKASGLAAGATWGLDNIVVTVDDTRMIFSNSERLSGPKACNTLAVVRDAQRFAADNYAVWGMGSNGGGQLGTGNYGQAYLPVRAQGLSWTRAVALGCSHMLTLNFDGTVMAVGSSSVGVLGSNLSNTPVPVAVPGLTDVVAVAAGSNHSVALKADGTVYSWGSNGSGQLGLGNSSTADRFSPTQVRDGTGAGYMTDATMVAAGEEHTLVVKADGSLWAFGKNGNGQLGNDTTDNSWLPVRVKNPAGTGFLTNVVLAAAGRYHSLAVTSNGTVFAWGYNGNGRLGNNSTTPSNLPVQVSGLTNVVAIAAGEAHNLVARLDGTVFAWGKNNEGQLGDGTTDERLTPVQVRNPEKTGFLTNIRQVGASANSSMARIPSPAQGGTVYTWGNNVYAQLGDGTIENRLLPVQVPFNFSQGSTAGAAVSGTGYHSLVVKSDGTLYAGGLNNAGQLGAGNADTYLAPVKVATGVSTQAGSVAAGNGHSLAVKTDGTLIAFGFNDNGQLGDGTLTPRTTPVPVTLPGGKLVRAVVAGSSFSLALATDNTVYAWGSNGSGQLGQGDTTPRYSPVQVKDAAGTGFLTGIIAIAAGHESALALKSDGTVFGWGGNGSGQLGLGNYDSPKLPTQIMTGAFSSASTSMGKLAMGEAHGLVVRANGTVAAFGYNGQGQLGAGSGITYSNLPVTVSGLTGAASVTAGNSHSVVRKSDGTVVAFGSNDHGQLGDGPPTTQYTPVPVPTLSAASLVAAGRNYTLVIANGLNNNMLWGMGAADKYQLLNGYLDARRSPTPAP